MMLEYLVPDLPFSRSRRESELTEFREANIRRKSSPIPVVLLAPG
jgi:hypothetical protein